MKQQNTSLDVSNRPEFPCTDGFAHHVHICGTWKSFRPTQCLGFHHLSVVVEYCGPALPILDHSITLHAGILLPFCRVKVGE